MTAEDGKRCVGYVSRVATSAVQCDDGGGSSLVLRHPGLEFVL